jgi:hypothetical protein
MPAWLKGAYTKVECYGMPLGSIPAGMTVPAILTADEIKSEILSSDSDMSALGRAGHRRRKSMCPRADKHHSV